MAEIRLKSTGTIKLFENDNTSSVTIASPASLGGDRTVTLPDASVTLASGTMLATDGDGSSLTALNASELGSGTVPTARLGSGTASSSTILYGDQTYKAEPTGGKVLQVVTATYSSQTASTSTTYADTGLTASITPSATTSRILVLLSHRCLMAGGAAVGHGNNSDMGLLILRDATTIVNSGSDSGGKYALMVSAENPSASPNTLAVGAWISISYIDSPSSTSELVYKTQLAIGTSGMAAAYTNDGYITLMEIGA